MSKKSIGVTNTGKYITGDKNKVAYFQSWRP